MFKNTFLLLNIIVISLSLFECYNQSSVDDNTNHHNIMFDDNSNSNNTIWNKSFLYIKRNMKECLQKEYSENLYHPYNFNINETNTSQKDLKEISMSIILTTTWIKCFKATSLKLFDSIATLKIITIMDGVQLIEVPAKNNLQFVNEKYKQINENIKNTKFSSKVQTKRFLKALESSSTDNRIEYGDKYKQNRKKLSNLPLHISKKDVLPLPSSSSSSTSTWLQNILKSISSTLTTRVIQIDLSKLEELQTQNNNNNENANNVVDDDNNKKKNLDSHSEIVTGRHRHRRNNMMLAMLFGVTAMGAIVIPVGFQFLSVIAGKALLLSKMALLLASISSLRKIASSGLHYGLYHLQDPYGGYGNYFDRGDAQTHPRFPRSSI